MVGSKIPAEGEKEGLEMANLEKREFYNKDNTVLIFIPKENICACTTGEVTYPMEEEWILGPLPNGLWGFFILLPFIFS